MKETVIQIQILSSVPLKVLSRILIKIFITKLSIVCTQPRNRKHNLYTNNLSALEHSVASH